MIRKAIAAVAGRVMPRPNTFDEIAKDIAARLPRERLSVFFDVGANTGQTIEKVTGRYTDARIFSFEPNPQTFKILARNAKSARTFNVGISSRAGTMRFDTSGSPDMHRIAENQADDSLPAVEVKTLDGICAGLGIAVIDYLKIDTEGHDLEVLRGAKTLLSRSMVNIIETECGMNRDNTHHVPFCQINSYLEDRDYRLFGIYEQVAEWPKSQPHLRRANAVFISKSVIDRNPYSPW